MPAGPSERSPQVNAWICRRPPNGYTKVRAFVRKHANLQYFTTTPSQNTSLCLRALQRSPKNEPRDTFGTLWKNACIFAPDLQPNVTHQFTYRLTSALLQHSPRLIAARSNCGRNYFTHPSPHAPSVAGLANDAGSNTSFLLLPESILQESA